ncbi:MAG: ORF6N domain-containing protein [Paracoccus sp. (in: a-proteobacteria)]|uniref:ORF6N domain-containing protein n=1 Tax=Paracoccus sp. TaxID=267 RepID=UPI0026DFC64E|nr:ORF6N domain-containing protein [Paracoccus sp. (in: a-proteobacteria)]MDO5631112.1 ORF6N domain-containing protein [Paracoccus sp. (in: a-proteobacteria)]
MTTLFDIAGIQARIHTLPGRTPFILSADLAEVYGTSVRAINQAVKRNQDIFPEDFAFRLTEAEEDQMWSQIVTTSAKKRDDFRTLVFTHAGANGLSAVLKTPTARKMHVAVHRAFAAMEAQALAEAKFRLQKLNCDVLTKKPIYVRVLQAVEQDWTFDQLWASGNYSRWRLENAIHEMLDMRMIDAPLRGMSRDMFAEAVNA